MGRGGGRAAWPGEALDEGVVGDGGGGGLAARGAAAA